MKFRNSFLKYIFDNSKIKTIILLQLIFNIIYPMHVATDFSYFSAYNTVENVPVFNLIIAFTILIVTLCTISLFDDYYPVIIRFKSKKEYLSELIKSVILVNLIVLIIGNAFLLISLLFSSNGIYIEKNYIYNISSLVYAIWVFIKKIIMFELLSVVYIYILKLVVKPFNVCLCIIWSGLLGFSSYYDKTVTSLSNIFIFYWDYFVQHRYISFTLEISTFVFYHCIYIFILSGIYYLIANKIKKISE